MKDKEKQIEEMSKEIVRMAGLDVYDKAEYLIQQGYRKIDKDSVVLTREEKQEYENLVKLLIYDKPIKSRVYEFIVETKEQARKETAENAFEITKKIIDKKYAIEIPSTRVTLSSIINQIEKELAKQFGVEIKE